MKDSVTSVMKTTMLFKGFDNDELELIQQNRNCRIIDYDKESVIFSDGDVPRKLYILLKGNVSIIKHTFSGKKIVIMNFSNPGDIFGEVYLYTSKESYDIQAETLDKSLVLEMSGDILKPNSGIDKDIAEKLKDNLLMILARKAYKLNNKVKVLGRNSIREKIAVYLLSNQAIDGSIKLNVAREEMAEYLNVPRPSLSREISNMVNEGIIERRGKSIEVVDQEKLESYL